MTWKCACATWSAGRQDPKLVSEVDIAQLEQNLQAHLGLPRPGGAAAVRVKVSRQPLLRVKRQIRTLRENAEQLGQLPVGYPFHVHAIMKIVSALLPWYTRSIRQFGMQTTQTIEEIAASLEELVKQQESLLEHAEQSTDRNG